MQVVCEGRATPVWRLTMRAEGPEGMGLDLGALSTLSGLLDEAAASPVCRVLVLEGIPGTFCRGMDLGRVLGEDENAVRRGVDAYAGCLRRLRSAPQAVIAVVDGAALGGGVGLAAAADLVLASARASFGLPEIVFGLLPAMVLPVLIARVGVSCARRLTLTAGSIAADEALTLGLVDRLTLSPDELPRLLRRTQKELLRARPEAVVRLRRVLAKSETLGELDAIDAGAEVTAEMLADTAVRTALAAFAAGELPAWAQGQPMGEA